MGELNEKQKQFCREYIKDWNATRAYDAVYKPEGKDTARVQGCLLLTKPNIKEYIKYVQSKLEEISGISKLRVLNELANIAFSTMGHYHNTWISKKEFDELTDEQKSCIQEVYTRVRRVKIGEEGYMDLEEVKIKLYDKHKALESISKMLGYDEPTKVSIVSSKPTIIFGDDDTEGINEDTEEVQEPI